MSAFPIVLFMCGGAWSAMPISATEVMDLVRKSEAEIEDVSLEFEHRMKLKITSDSQLILGEVAVSRHPERFKVHYTSPVEQVMVYDGRVLTFYLPEAGQAFRKTAPPDVLSRLIGVNPLAPTGALKGYEASLEGCDDGVCSLIFARQLGEMYGGATVKWRLDLDAATWLVRRAVMETEEMTVSVRCLNYRINEGIPDKAFSIELPPGTTVQDGIPFVMGLPGAEGTE